MAETLSDIMGIKDPFAKNVLEASKAKGEVEAAEKKEKAYGQQEMAKAEAATTEQFAKEREPTELKQKYEKTIDELGQPFIPTQQTAGNLGNIFAMTNILGFLIGGGAKGSAQAALSAQNGMLEYSEKHTSSRIMGSPPGYIGYDDSTTELDKIKLNPYSLVLLDEIEKADPQVVKLFLQVMKEGHITSADGEKINCRNIILVMTGNFGMNESKTTTLGFGSNEPKTDYEVEQARLIHACKELFGAEFVNRVDEFVPFLPLSKDSLIRIIDLHLKELAKRLTHIKCEFVFSTDVSNAIFINKNSEHGANAMVIDRIISKQIEPAIADVLLGVKPDSNIEYTITIALENDKFRAILSEQLVASKKSKKKKP